MAVRPPEARLGNGQFRAARLRDDLAVVQEPAGEGRGGRRIVAAVLRTSGVDVELHRNAVFTGLVGLAHAGIDDAPSAPGFQADVAVDPARGEARPPIPAEGTLLLADVVAAADRVVRLADVVGPAAGVRCSPSGWRTRRRVRCGQPSSMSFTGEPVAGEHVLRARDFLAVERDGGEGVEAVGDEFDGFLREESRRRGQKRCDRSSLRARSIGGRVRWSRGTDRGSGRGVAGRGGRTREPRRRATAGRAARGIPRIGSGGGRDG